MLGGKDHLEVYEKRRLETAEKAKETSAHFKQRADRLKVATQYKNLTAEEWGYFVPNICFRCPIQKMILFGVLRRAKFLQRIGLKKVQNGSYGAE